MSKTIDKLLIDLRNVLMPEQAGHTYTDFTDVPYLPYDDKEYVTYRPITTEQEEEEEETPTDTPEESPPEEGMGEEMGIAGDEFGAGELGAGGEPIKTPSEIGRIYELKKIYSRLLSIESFLANSTDIRLLKLRNYVTKVLELFNVLTSNLPTFKEKIDDIIVKLYRFLQVIYALMDKYYQRDSEET